MYFLKIIVYGTIYNHGKEFNFLYLFHFVNFHFAIFTMFSSSFKFFPKDFFNDHGLSSNPWCMVWVTVSNVSKKRAAVLLLSLVASLTYLSCGWSQMCSGVLVFASVIGQDPYTETT
jgi:hypothetical protein